MRILFLQKPHLLARQLGLVEAAVAELGAASLTAAGSPEQAGRHRDAEVVLAPALPWLPEALRHLPRLRWIHFLSAGVDPIWAMPFDKRRYLMSKSVGVHAATITEYVLGAILYVLKGFGVFQRQQARHEWRRVWLDECHGKTLAILGIGTIGARLAEHASRLGMRVVGTVSSPRDMPYVERAYGSAELYAAVGEADFVAVLVPLTDQTRGMIDAGALAQMKQTAWLINVARGEVVDQAALVCALEQGTIGGAVLDVFDEAPLPEHSPLWAMENVLVTPHVAGTTQHYMPRALDIFKQNYLSLEQTGQLATPVSVEKGY